MNKIKIEENKASTYPSYLIEVPKVIRWLCASLKGSEVNKQIKAIQFSGVTKSNYKNVKAPWRHFCLLSMSPFSIGQGRIYETHGCWKWERWLGCQLLFQRLLFLLINQEAFVLRLCVCALAKSDFSISLDRSLSSFCAAGGRVGASSLGKHNESAPCRSRVESGTQKGLE